MSDPKLNQEISDLKRANEELSLLNDIAHSIGLTFEFEGIVRTIIDKSIRSVGAEQGAIVLVDDEAGHGAHTLDRRIVTAGGPDELGLHPLIVGWMTLHHEPLNLSAPQNDERFKDPPWDQSIKSVACVPMLVQTTLIGILAVFNKQNAPSFSDDDVRLLGIIAASSAQVVENARLHGVEELHEKLKTFQTQLIRSKTMASLGALVAGLLHEINTPLGVIRSANDVSARCAAKIQEALAAGAVDDDARARITHFLKSIEENTEAIASAEGRVARIVSSLKSFAPPRRTGEQTRVRHSRGIGERADSFEIRVARRRARSQGFRHRAAHLVLSGRDQSSVRPPAYQCGERDRWSGHDSGANLPERRRGPRTDCR